MTEPIATEGSQSLDRNKLRYLKDSPIKREHSAMCIQSKLDCLTSSGGLLHDVNNPLTKFPVGLLRLAYALSGAQHSIQLNKIKDEYSRSKVVEALHNFKSKKKESVSHNRSKSECYYDAFHRLKDEYEIFDSLSNDIEKCILIQVDPGLDLYRIILAPDRSWIHGWRRIKAG